MSLDDLYREVILDHYQHPRNRGRLESPDIATRGHNPLCGDEVELALNFDGETVSEAAFGGRGCSISQASASVLHELLVGSSLDKAMAALDEFTALMQSRGQREPDEDVLGDGIAFAGVSKYPARVKCALLAWMAFKDATARAVEGSGVT